jgi:protein ImuB
MSRIVSVWLPRWPILRYLAAQAVFPSDRPVDPDQPFVLAIAGSGGPRIAALNEAAEAAGLGIGEPVADGRAKAGFLQVRDIDAAADAAALRRLTLWATRYTPTASSWSEENGADGLFLDVEGAAHLFDGEESLLTDLARRLDQFGLPARLAVAGTPGAAWALARFHPAPLVVLPPGEEAAALAPLPVEALRLSLETCSTLRRLGLKSVGALLDKPRAPFAARFPAELLRRVDQALGRVDEPLVPIVAPPVYHSLRYLPEPILTQDAVVRHANRLMQMLVRVLERDDVGARALRLCLYRVDGAVEVIDIGLTLPTRSVAHVARLIDLKLEALAAMREADFGFEAIGLAVTRADPIPARQTELTSGWGNDDSTERCAALIDTLRQRLGPQSVQQFQAVASHIPERAETLTPLAAETLQSSPDDTSAWSTPESNPRPLLLLPRAEPTKVMALVPDGPPQRFSWRGVTYEVAGAQGPERIAGGWWLDVAPAASAASAAHSPSSPSTNPALTRDYYLVEDIDGRRFWLFREGLYGRETTTPARWFVQGLWA